MSTRTAARFVFLSLACMIVVSLAPAVAQTSSVKYQAPSRILSPVDDSIRVTVPRSMHPMARPAYDVGPLESSTALQRMILVLGASPEQEQQARAFLDSQQTKGSPDYHRWLTPEEFGQKFGPSAQDVQQITGWLRQHGFAIGGLAKSGRWVEFSGTSAQVEAAFQTQMRKYRVAGAAHIANSSDVSIPAALSPVVRGVLSLHDFFSRPMHRHAGTLRPTANGMYVHTDGTFPQPDGSVVHALAPGDFARIYDLNPLYTNSVPVTGAGQTIAIVARSDIVTQDVADFRSTFGLPANPVNVILNGPDPGDVPGDDIEATLDTEWSGAVAPGATIDLVISAVTTTTDGVDLSAMYIVDNNLAQIMSVSFGQCEQFLGPTENNFFNSLWQQAAAQGISVFVSAGDDGAAGCDDPNDPSNRVATGGVAVSGLASTPFNTAVGGTQFNEKGSGENPSPGTTDATFWNSSNSGTFVSVKGYIPEMVWNESCNPLAAGSPCAQQGNLFAGSGGLSTLYGQPSWQTLSITGLTGSGFTQRALPDVSLTAAGHDPYLLCFQTSCEQGFFVGVGGTSASSPSFAGIMALVDQKVGARQGLANYVLYPLAAAENFGSCNSNVRINPGSGTACIFNDTTVGNNGVPGNDVTNQPTAGSVGYLARTGYDLGTGLGSVDANNLVTNWTSSFKGSQTTLNVTSPSLTAGVLKITHGQAITVNVQVQKAGGGTGPTGTTALVTNLQGPTPGSIVTIGAGSLDNTGAFTGTFSNLPGGSYSLNAHYPGDGNFGASDSTGIPAVVAAENSSIALSSLVADSKGNIIPGTTAPYGDFLDLRSVVTSATNASPPDAFPSGPVTFLDGGTPLGNLNLNSQAQAELIDCSTPVTTPTQVPCLTVGSHSITANYGGDLGFNASGPTAPINITITKGNPAVGLTAPTTANFNQTVTLTAVVPPTGTILPTGTVQFFDGANSLGSPVLLAGNPPQATMQVGLTPSGNHKITASYSGDSTYNPAASAASTVTVGAPFNFTATSSSQTIMAGGTATYNVTMNGVGGFTGQVSFACAGAPGGASCTVSPNPASLSSTTTSVPLTVTVSNTTNARLIPHSFKSLPFVFAGILAAVLAGVRRNPRQRVFLLLAVFLVAGISSCGGGGGGTVPRLPTNATLTVTGTSSSGTNMIMLTLTVTH